MRTPAPARIEFSIGPCTSPGIKDLVGDPTRAGGTLSGFESLDRALGGGSEGAPIIRCAELGGGAAGR